MSKKNYCSEESDMIQCSCAHAWQFIPDWEGNPGIPNGTRDCSFWQCWLCGEETYDKPAKVESY